MALQVKNRRTAKTLSRLSIFLKRDEARNPDIPLIISLASLLAFGLVAVYSASFYSAIRMGADSSRFLEVQFFATLIGLAAMTAAAWVNHKVLEYLAWPALGATLILLILVLIPGIGKESGGARRWLDLFIVDFQPSELAKLTLILFLAHLLSARRLVMGEFVQGFLVASIVPLLMVVLVLLEKDLSYSMVLVMITAVMFYAGRVRVLHMLSAGLLAVPAIGLAVWLEPYRMRRLTAFLDPEADPRGAGWQIIQSKIALGSGGFFRFGLGASRQNRGFLPEPHTDFIFSIIGEEFGFLVSAFIVFLYGMVLWRGMRIAVRTGDQFGRLLAVGITTMVSFQALINLGVVTGLLPSTGMPLPLISYGGSSLCINLFALGILLGISRQMDLSPHGAEMIEE